MTKKFNFSGRQDIDKHKHPELISYYLNKRAKAEALEKKKGYGKSFDKQMGIKKNKEGKIDFGF